MECINSQDDQYQFGNFELSQIDDAFLMSFLDDSQVEGEYCDNEKLSSVMRSLEAELIDQRTIHVDQYMDMVDNNSTTWKNDESFDDDHDGLQLMEGYDETSGSTQQDFGCCNWMDMEMNVMVPSSPGNHGIASWYMDHYTYSGDEMDTATVLKFENEIDYYFDHFNGISTTYEDHDEHGPYGTLGQEA